MNLYKKSLYQFELLYSDISRDIACFLLIDIDMCTINAIQTVHYCFDVRALNANYPKGKRNVHITQQQSKTKRNETKQPKAIQKHTQTNDRTNYRSCKQ